MYKKALSLALVLVMLFTFVPAQAASTASDAENQAIQVTVNVTDSWNNGYNADCIITNTGNEAITDWVIGFDFADANRITNLWNGTIVSSGGGEVIVRNAGWNANIPVGGTVSFGFISETNGELNLPENFALCERVRQEVSTTQAEFVLYSDWGAGFNGAIRVKNNDAAPLESWIVEFTFNGRFTSVSSGTLIGQALDGRWSVTDAGWNAVLQAGSSTDVQVLGEGNVLTMADFRVYTTTYERFVTEPEHPFDSEDNRLVILDSPELSYFADGNWYGADNAVYGLAGRINCDFKLKSVRYTLDSSLGVVSGNLPARKSWATSDVRLGFGQNELTFFITDTTGNEYSETVSIINFNTEYLDNNDDDSDGLSNWMEDYLGTDKQNPDTDADGLTDEAEVFKTLTDPLQFDTDGNGIGDGDEDIDADGLTADNELRHGTDLYNPDTDGDTLSDGDEVFSYGSDPLKPDTDSDGLPDALEPEYGMNPVNPDTLGDGILDGDREFTVKRDGEESDNGQVRAFLELDLQGSQIESLTIDNVSEDDVFLNPDVPGYLGNAVDLHVDGDFDSATLTFEFDPVLLNNPDFVPAIFYWDEDAQILTELPNQNIVGNTVSAELEHFSMYIVLAKNDYYEELFRFGIMAPTDEAMQSKQFDVALVLDESGSVSAADYQLMKNLSRDLVKNLGDDDRISIFTFDSTVRTRSGFVDKSSADSILSTLPKAGGGTAICNAINAANTAFIKSSYSDATKIMIVLTDGQDGSNSVTASAVAKTAVDNNIVIYTIGVGSVNASVLTTIAQNTGGAYYSASNFSQLTGVFKRLEQDVDLYRDTDGDGISDYHEKKIAAGELLFGTGAPLRGFNTLNHFRSDSDGDGIPDGEELVIMEQYVEGRSVYYCFMYSNPRMKDSDGDGLLDGSAVEINGKVAGPKDQEPLKQNGPKGIWQAHFDKLRSGPAPSEYVDAIPEFNPPIDKKTALMANYLMLLNRDFLNGHQDEARAAAFLLRQAVGEESLWLLYAYICAVQPDEDRSALHSQVDTWQRKTGYNDMIDDLFRTGSRMKPLKVLFPYSDRAHVLWAWKGDYWSLGDGAEMGLYYDSGLEVSGTKHYNAIDYELPMTLHLYKDSKGGFEKVFNWEPVADQWWITGFNPRYQHGDPDDMTVIGTVELDDNEMFDALKNATIQKDSRGNTNPDYVEDSEMYLIFDEDGHTVWIIWG